MAESLPRLIARSLSGLSLSSALFCVWHDSRKQLRQLVCGYRGHMALLCRRSDRVWLRCAVCQHETPGWTLHTWNVRFAWKRSRRELWESEAWRLQRRA